MDNNSPDAEAGKNNLYKPVFQEFFFGNAAKLRNPGIEVECRSLSILMMNSMNGYICGILILQFLWLDREAAKFSCKV